MDSVPLSYLILGTINVLVVCVSFLSLVLYRKAYFEMKKSPMILSVLLLLLAIFVFSVYDLILTGQDILYGQVNHLLNEPIIAIFPRLFGLLALGYFIHTSVSPQEDELKKKN